LLRRDNIGSYRYKIINWGLVLLRAGTLCAPGLFIVVQQEVRNVKPPFMALQDTRKYILLLESRYQDADIGGIVRKYGQVRAYHGDA